MKRGWTRNVDLLRSKPPAVHAEIAADSALAAIPKKSSEDGPAALALALARPPAGTMADPDAGDRQRDQDLESVYRRHSPSVSRWAARLAGPGFDVEDIVHDVFLVVQRRLGEFRGDALMSTWLYEITVRVVQARRRSWRRRRSWMWIRPDEIGDAEAGAAKPADERVSPLDALERRQATVLLYRLLDELDEKYRTAVVLFELEGVSCQQIAAITGTSVSNVWARVSRGREKLIKAFAASEAKKIS